MVTKTLVRISDGAIMSTVAVTAPNDGNRNNHQPPKKKDDGSKSGDDKKIAAKETAVKHHNVSTANNEVEVDNMSTTHDTAKTKDENKSTATGTRRSSRQKRPVVFNDDDEEDADRGIKKRRRKQGKEKLIIDLKGVPMQVPILKHDGKKGAFSSKYVGVNWNKPNKKWLARIWIDGKDRYIGCYDNEEDAAADYARAVFKYNGGSDGIDRLKVQQRKGSLEKVDLSGVPMQVPILKHDGNTDGLSSKYVGVFWYKSTKKWETKITIDGKNRYIGTYNNEKDAAIDYARAVFKYNGGNDGIERLKAQQRGKASLEKIDLSGVPKQQLIMKPNGKRSSTSKYLGVSFLKKRNKWQAAIRIDGKDRYIGCYDNEEDAAADYARAVFKYKGGNAEVKSQDESQQLFNLIQVPAIPPAGYDPLKGGPISALKVTEYEI